ncbi:MAG: MMPL family transporter [Nesterenkonia sp.]|nr:MMPL family transporter [Nesterenkonia sp.]
MAKFLYRLGLLSARRAKTVVGAWFAILAIAITSFLSFGGQLTNQISMPDLETTEVADRMAEEIEDGAGGSAQAVIRTDDGEPFTDEQQEQLTDVFDEVEQNDSVSSVTDPFEAADEADSGRAEVEDGQEELEDGRAQLEEGQDEIDSGQDELDSGQEQLDAAISEAQDAGMYEAAQDEFEQQQDEIDAGREELDQAQSDLDENREELESGEAELERGEQMLELSDGMGTVSEDGDVAVLTVNFPESVQGVDMDDLSAISETLVENDVDGVEILPSQDLAFETPELFSKAEAIGLLVAAIVLIVMLGTLIGAGLPLLNALIGVGVGVAGALSLSGLVEMMSVTPILGLMLGLAVGIDYALFILHRHRRQLKEGMDVVDSIALANGTAGNAVVFAGVTVIIALLALNVTGVGFLALMGSVAAFCVFIAALMAVTMTPATMSLVGMRILSKKERARVGHVSAGAVTEGMRTPRQVLIALAAVAALVALAIPAFSLRLGLPDASAEAEDSAPYQAYQEIDESFGAGMNSPLLVLADMPGPMDDDEATDEQIAVAQELGTVDDVEAAVPTGTNDDGSVASFAVIPTDGPASESTEDLVHELRDGDVLAGTDVSDVDLSVAGAAAANIDISDVIADALPLYLGLVVGLSLLLMVMVFRSLLLPLVATLGFIGSFAAAMGAVVAVYQWGWLSELFGVTGTGPILTFLPIIAMGILFGLGMDYQLFTATGMREAYAHGAKPRVAVRRGLLAGRAVVTAAALIMASVFAGFIFTDDVMVTSIGFALALGVLLDAFVVRLLLVPAVLHLLGPAAWWLPQWMDRLIPDVDVEGAALEAEITKRSEGAGI